MGFILSSAAKDIRRWRQDVTAILLWLGIPFLVGGLLTSMMPDDGASPRGTLLIVDQDQSFLSGLVAGAYSQGGIGDLISVETVELVDGNERIDAGEASGLLIIPDGFSAALLESTPVTLTLRTNPAQTILPGIIRDVTEILLDAGFYANQLFGDEISRIVNDSPDGGPDDAFVTSIAVSIRQKIDAAAPQLFPPAIDLTIVEPPPEERSIPLALLFMPGIILIAVLFSSSGLANDFWKEREQGTLRRLVYTPGQLVGFVVGKALAAAIVVGTIGAITLVAGFLVHDLPWSRMPSATLWITVGGLAFFAWFAFLQMTFSNKRAASVVTMALLFPLLMAGGSFFPLAILPDWIAAIGRLSPNGFVADRLTTELTVSASWAIDLQSWLIIIGLAIAGLGLCAWRLRAGFARN